LAQALSQMNCDVGMSAASLPALQTLRSGSNLFAFAMDWSERVVVVGGREVVPITIGTRD
jgi:hypothetical protein